MKHRNLLIGLAIVVYLTGIPLSAGRYYATVPRDPNVHVENRETDHRTKTLLVGGILWPVYWPSKTLYNAAGGR